MVWQATTWPTVRTVHCSFLVFIVHSEVSESPHLKVDMQQVKICRSCCYVGIVSFTIEAASLTIEAAFIEAARK